MGGHIRTSRNEASFFNYMHCGNDPRKRRFALMTSVAALSLASSAPAGLTANFPNGEAFRGGIGMRLGDVWLKTAQYEIDSSVTGKVWDQFHTNNGVTLQSGGTDLFLDDRYQKVFGEVTGQLNVTNTSTGWSAFTNTGVQFNSQFLTVTGKGGVRYQW
jgi:hypothetical protein